MTDKTTEPTIVPAKDFWDRLTDYDQEIMSIFATEQNVVIDALAAVPDKASKTVADFGCGVGNSFVHLKDFRTVYAVDYSENMLELARKQRQPNVELMQGDIVETRLPEPCDLTLALASVMPENLVHFHAIIQNLVTNTAENGSIFMALPSLESRTFGYQLEVEIQAQKGRDPVQIMNSLMEQITLYQFNPLGYMLTDGGMMQKAWLREEIEFRLSEYGFRAVNIHKFEVEWERQVKRPDMKHLPRHWLWFVEIQT
ncbi:MAG: methyltransferase domain-containing protein [Proteobacteria bacterium]|nr:methyltransferase domain-containing protein [Pseudomonadota bacterium]